MVNHVKFVTVLQKHRLSLTAKQIINLTAAKDSLFIYLHAINALKNMLGKS